MPSNVLTYAVSGTGNKHIDIINNHLDALYSVANFLKKKGWKTGEPVSMKVHVKGKKFHKYVTESPCNGYKVTVKTLKNAGVSFPFNISQYLFFLQIKIMLQALSENIQHALDNKMQELQ